MTFARLGCFRDVIKSVKIHTKNVEMRFRRSTLKQPKRYSELSEVAC